MNVAAEGSRARETLMALRVVDSDASVRGDRVEPEDGDDRCGGDQEERRRGG